MSEDRTEERRASYTELSGKSVKLTTALVVLFLGGTPVGVYLSGGKMDKQCVLEPCITLKQDINRLRLQLEADELQSRILKDEIYYLKRSEKHRKETSREPTGIP